MINIPNLAAALKAVAPHADPAVWVPALSGPMAEAGITLPRRIAAFLGQCAIESAGFTALAENTLYTHADRLAAIFPHCFPSSVDAAPYAGHAEAIANKVYANRMGNGDEASGDGWRFRGAGLLQLTGRDEIGGFAKDACMTIEAAADFLRTPAGAAQGACWYWTTHGLNTLADGWQLPAITRAINGAAMAAAAERSTASVAALNAVFA